VLDTKSPKHLEMAQGHISLSLEKRLRRPEPGRAVHWRDRRRSRVAKATSRADVLGGQLAEAMEWPVEPPARAGFLEETPTTMAQARC
jgi:hypothetical protein